MRLEDKITVAIVGGIGSNKGLLRREVKNYSDVLLQALEGNFWVPAELADIEEQRNDELFRKYSEEPEAYAFEFQMNCMAERLEQQGRMQENQGLVITGQPLEVDRIFAEANRENIRDAFSTYEVVFNRVSKIVVPPDIVVYCRIRPEEVEVAQRRIKATGLPEEQKFVEEPAYLVKVFELFEEKFAEGNRKNVIEIKAADPALDSEGDETYFQEVFSYVAGKIREYKEPPRLTLMEWEAVDYNQAQDAERRGRRQLKQYLSDNLIIITLAGLVGGGKTGLAELISDRLEIDIMKELQRRNDEIADELLDKFLRNKREHCYALQEYLIPKRLEARKTTYTRRRSYVEDRSPEEDQCIFWRLFHEQGLLTDEQLSDLQKQAKEAYAGAPKSKVMIRMDRDPKEVRKMILERGRKSEVSAWPLGDLEMMNRFYKGQKGLFEDMKQYNSHDGPKLGLDMQEFDARNSIHLGYLWQEILHGLLEHREREK